MWPEPPSRQGRSLWRDTQDSGEEIGRHVGTWARVCVCVSATVCAGNKLLWLACQDYTVNVIAAASAALSHHCRDKEGGGNNNNIIIMT